MSDSPATNTRQRSKASSKSATPASQSIPADQQSKQKINPRWGSMIYDHDGSSWHPDEPPITLESFGTGIIGKLRRAYFLYAIHVGVYAMEPYERYALNTIFALVFMLLLWASVVYMPGHLLMLYRTAQSLFSFLVASFALSPTNMATGPQPVPTTA